MPKPRSSVAEFLSRRKLTPVIEASDSTDALTPTSSRGTDSDQSSSVRTVVEHYSPKKPPNFSRPQLYTTQSEYEGQQSKDRALALPVKPVHVSIQEDVLGGTSDDFEWTEHLRGMEPLIFGVEPETNKVQPLLKRARSVPASKPRTYPPVKIADDTADDCSWDGEDGRSHHTVSEDGYMDEQDIVWDRQHDLTGRELKKLKKKGISPSLYLEMKQARNGRRRWVNPLAGNSFLA